MSTDATTLLPTVQRWPVLLCTAAALMPLLLQLPVALAALIALTWLLVAAASNRWHIPTALRLLLVVVMLASIAQLMGMRPGRDTGCALLAAMLAIKGSELHTLRDARSTLGFALFAPFAAFLLDQGPSTLLLGLLAAALILATLAGLARWAVGLDAGSVRSRLRQLGVLLLLATPISLAAFWLLPRLDGPLWGLPDRAVSRPGLSSTLEPGQWLDMMVDDSAALRVHFQDAVPAPEQRYWRGPVMSAFDGRRWHQSDIAVRLATPLPAQQVRQPLWQYRIEYEPTDKRQLVALDLPLAAPPGSRLDSQHSLTSVRRLGSLSHWQLASAPRSDDPTPLPAPLRRYLLQLPPGYNPRTLALGRQWRQQAGGDDAAIVSRALEWIGRDFAYTLSTPLPGRHLADEFLFDQQAGYCEHFSSAFAILMRSAGIPSRVVTGYSGGLRNRYGGYWLVRRMDAHAWTEVWLGGRGWVRVDPTAAVAPERIYDTIEDRLGPGGGDATGLLPAITQRWQAMREAGDWLRQRWNQQVLGYDASAQARLLERLSIQHGALGNALLLLAWLGSSAAGLWLMWWWLSRRPATDDPLLSAWQTLGQRYAAQGLAPRREESAAAWARRVAAQHPDSPLPALAHRYNAQRYAAAGNDPGLLRALRQHRPTRN